MATSAFCARGSPTRSSSSTRIAGSRWPRASIALRSIVYHNKLGTLVDRVERLRFIARNIGPRIGAEHALADRAALLAKADLVTDMVGEFPELQGTMGRYYAQHDGESPAVADAIAQHYWPRYAGDALPEAAVAQAVALADKLETLAGMFGIGALPTGDKRPVRIAACRDRRVAHHARKAPARCRCPACWVSRSRHSTASRRRSPCRKRSPTSCYDRLRGHLREQGYTANQVEAVLAQRPQRIDLVPDRLAAVKAFEALPEAAALSAANKRIVNILRRSGGEAAAGVDVARLGEGAERDLWHSFEQLAPEVDAPLRKRRLRECAEGLATAKPAVDRFFDDVMVMADDAAAARKSPGAAQPGRGHDEPGGRHLEARCLTGFCAWSSSPPTASCRPGSHG